ncbi:MAG TPA: TonB-dependent receptor [Noviherbaspirillum sp.]
MNPTVAITAPAARPLVLALAVSSLFSTLSSIPAYAQQGQTTTLAPVIVSANRFASDAPPAPIGASVISAEEIREAGINNVNEAVRRLAGVPARLNFSGTQDYSLDLRGFGGTSDQNLVILVDGIRLSENEQAPALLSSIPIDSVERIEIVRGGSSVLYGEGATGGTIQIVTKRGAQKGTHGSVTAEAGSFGHREARASVEHGWNGFSLDASAGSQRADNYRDNNDIRQGNFSGGLQWASERSRLGLRVDVARQDARFPGSLSLAQFLQNPRQTLTPNDFGSYDTDRYTLFAEHKLGAFDLAAEISQRDRSTISGFGGGTMQADSRTTQFSPRVRHRAESNGVRSELVAGLDFTHWEREASWGSDNLQRARAFYLREELRIGQARLAAGARHEKFRQESDFGGIPSYRVTRSLNAWDLQGSYALAPALEVFAKAGRSYRLPNADDNASTPVFNQPLQPQTSNDLELGTTWGTAGRSVTVRAFQHKLRNEVFYDPSVGLFGANVNLDPTSRRGLEIEASLRVHKDVLLSANAQHVKARFRGGPYAGNEMLLVPRNSASLRLQWLPGNAHSAFVGLQWVDSQRYGSDVSNTCVRMPSYTVLDARYAYRTGPWEFAVAGSNLTDRDYFTNAFACQGGIYPDPGRQLKASVRYTF